MAAISYIKVTISMEAVVIENEDTICKIVRTHFLRLREDQKSGKQKEKDLTDDIIFTFTMVSQNVGQPVQVLKAMGIVFLGDAIAFNFSLFQAQVICCQTRALAKLRKEEWVDVSEQYKKRLGTLIGLNEVKNWMTFRYPPNSKLAEFLRENPKLIATESSFGLDRAPNFVLIGPGMPPDDVLKEPHFPLVSIQYERQMERPTIVFTHEPKATTVVPERKFTLSATRQINILYTK